MFLNYAELKWQVACGAGAGAGEESQKSMPGNVGELIGIFWAFPFWLQFSLSLSLSFSSSPFSHAARLVINDDDAGRDLRFPPAPPPFLIRIIMHNYSFIYPFINRPFRRVHIAQSIYRFSSCRHVLGRGRGRNSGNEWKDLCKNRLGICASPHRNVQLIYPHIILCISYIVMFVLFIVTKWGLGLFGNCRTFAQLRHTAQWGSRRSCQIDRCFIRFVGFLSDSEAIRFH